MRRASSCLLILLAAAPAAAQDLSDQEIIERWEAQVDAFQAAEDDSLGAPRGIELMTIDDLVTDPALSGEATADAAAAGAAGTASGSGSATVTQSSQPSGPIVVGVIEEPLQVNVRITFAYDSAVLADDQLPTLARLCGLMKESDINLFRIVGHTDAAGTDAYNERLSLLRAEEVERYFVSTCRLDAARLEAVGMGERFLADPDDPDAGENRRVEFQALS